MNVNECLMTRCGAYQKDNPPVLQIFWANIQKSLFLASLSHLQKVSLHSDLNVPFSV